MCRSSTTTIGSTTAVLRLRSPEEEEPDDQRDHGPAYGVVPEVIRVRVVVAVGAVHELRLGRRRGMARVDPDPAQMLVVGLGAGRAVPLGGQQRVPDQRDV